MGRLLDWPVGVGIVGRTPLAGPRAIGASSSESLAGYVQTVAGVFGVWQWQLRLNAMRGETFRRYRGLVAALHGGSNAVRVPFYDPDGPYTLIQETWSDGGLWSGGQSWEGVADWVAVGAAAALGDTEIRLADTGWGHALGVGDYLGLLPLHFGLYVVTEVRAPGVYRVWPPLRKALTTDDYAHLWPVMVMRLQGEDGAGSGRGLETSDGASMTLIEVPHDVVVDYFADAAL